MCCWMGSRFHNWVDFNGVTLLAYSYYNVVTNFSAFCYKKIVVPPVALTLKVCSSLIVN